MYSLSRPLAAAIERKISMNIIKRLMSVLCCMVLAAVFCTSTVSGNVAFSVNTDGLAGKLSPELKKLIAEHESSETIPVFVFRKMMTEDAVNNKIIEAIKNSDFMAGDLNNSAALLKLRIELKSDGGKYLGIRHEVLKEEYEASNKAFISRNNILDSNIIYTASYTSTVVVEATVGEILKMALLDEVDYISMYENLEQEPELDTVLSQVGADKASGTTSKLRNSGNGYTGKGIVIGVIEASAGRYDASSPHLNGIPESQLKYIYNTDDKGNRITPSVSDHATKVVSMLIGRDVTVNGVTYGGIVQDATVYQTSANNMYDVLNAFTLLADAGVHIINYSGGSTTEGYNDYDREIDRYVESTKVVFVKSAGNSSGEITSPGKGINVITVGNLETKSYYDESALAPFRVAGSSAYLEESYLSNKPDIVAPGTYITTAKTGGGINSGSGTSFSAPIVAGIIAQMMQRAPSLKGNPYRVKSLVISFSDNDDILTDENGKVDNDYILERSGAGLIDAMQMLGAFTHANGILRKTGATYVFNKISIKAGQTIRIVLAAFKSNGKSISSYSDIDNLDLRLMLGKEVVSTSTSKSNSVEIIEFTATETGKYIIQITAEKVADPSAGVPYGISWRFV